MKEKKDAISADIFTRFQKGHNLSKKLKTDELQREAYIKYCKHIADGYPKKTFSYVNDDLSITSETMEKYIKENKDSPNFDPLLMQIAEAQAFKGWFDEGKKMMTGVYKNGSPMTWQVIMRNMFRKYGWDIEQKEMRTNSQPDMQRLSDSLNNISLHRTPELEEKIGDSIENTEE